MKTISILYFTGTGNSLYAAEYLRIQLERFSFSVEIKNISDVESIDTLKDRNILFFIYPIYGSTMPTMMSAFIKALPESYGQSVGVIATQLAFSGDGSSILYSTLKRKGYIQKWGYQVNMPNNLSFRGSPFFQSADYAVHEKKHLRKVRKKLDRVVNSIISDRKRVGDNTIFHKILAMSQRPLYKKYAIKSYQSTFSVNNNCIGCKKCIRNCPAGVITWKDGIEFTHTERCQVCLRCLNFCPVSAILHKGAVREPLYKGPTQEIYKRLFS